MQPPKSWTTVFVLFFAGMAHQVFAQSSCTKPPLSVAAEATLRKQSSINRIVKGLLTLGPQFLVVVKVFVSTTNSPSISR